MISARITAIATLIVLCLVTHGNARQGKLDGNFWNTADRPNKELIIDAVFWGQELAYDQILVESILEGNPANYQADCSSSVRSLLDSLRAKQKSVDSSQVVGKMDHFYSVPENRLLQLKWAFLEAILRLKNTPEAEINEWLEEVRKSNLE